MALWIFRASSSRVRFEGMINRPSGYRVGLLLHITICRGPGLRVLKTWAGADRRSIARRSVEGRRPEWKQTLAMATSPGFCQGLMQVLEQVCRALHPDGEADEISRHSTVRAFDRGPMLYEAFDSAQRCGGDK